MKLLLFTLAFFLLASTAQAQQFYSPGTNQAIYTRSWSYSVSTYGNYGYGYGFPAYRYQMPVPQQTYFPAHWGAVPGYYTNGYFVPGVWGVGW